MSQSFVKPYKRSDRNVKVEMDLTNYTPKSDLKKVKNVDTSKFAKKADLSTLKLYIYELDVHKLETVPVGLRS